MEFRQSWFGANVPQNCKGSSITIGAGDNGQVTVTSTTVIGEEANVFSIEVVAGVGLGVDLSAAFANDKITVTLGTDGAGVLDDTKNTAILVAAEIDDIAGFSAVHSGDGSTVIAITAQKASAIIGDGETDNSYVTVEYDTPGVDGNALSIVVEDGDAQDGALAAELTEGVLTITLGMTDVVEFAPDDAKNTATLIAGVIDAIDGLSATAHGTGEGVPAIADEDEISFEGGTTGVLSLTGGQYGTECPDPKVVMRNWNVGNGAWDYYALIAPNGKYDANWRRFNLVDF